MTISLRLLWTSAKQILPLLQKVGKRNENRPVPPSRSHQLYGEGGSEGGATGTHSAKFSSLYRRSGLVLWQCNGHHCSLGMHSLDCNGDNYLWGHGTIFNTKVAGLWQFPHGNAAVYTDFSYVSTDIKLIFSVYLDNDKIFQDAYFEWTASMPWPPHKELPKTLIQYSYYKIVYWINADICVHSQIVDIQPPLQMIWMRNTLMN